MISRLRGLALPSVGRLTALLAIAIAGLGLAGIAYYAVEPGSPWGRLDLDGEQTLPSAFSALVLIGAGVCALVLARRRTLGARFSWLLLGLLLSFMGIDEFAAIHESLEEGATVDWQTLYLPVIAACGAAWLLVTVRLSRCNRQAFYLMVAGAGTWLVAQVLENLQWGANDQPVSGYGYLMITEEVLEMAGSACFLVALYTVLWAVYGDGASAD